MRGEHPFPMFRLATGEPPRRNGFSEGTQCCLFHGVFGFDECRGIRDRKFNRTGGWRRADATIAGRRVASAAREPTGREGMR
jgi:hypothetical protein